MKKNIVQMDLNIFHFKKIEGFKRIKSKPCSVNVHLVTNGGGPIPKYINGN